MQENNSAADTQGATMTLTDVGVATSSAIPGRSLRAGMATGQGEAIVVAVLRASRDIDGVEAGGSGIAR